MSSVGGEQPRAAPELDPALAAGAHTELSPARTVTSERPIPQGPGVVPPFAAPPTDGLRRRMWLGLTLSAIAVVVLCIGGLGGCIALGLTAEKARTNAATHVVNDFLVAWEHGNYAGAYQLTCDELKNQVSLSDFTGQLSARQLAGFEIGTPDLTTQVAKVPVRLEFVEGGFDEIVYRVVVNNQGKSVVCGTQA